VVGHPIFRYYKSFGYQLWAQNSDYTLVTLLEGSHWYLEMYYWGHTTFPRINVNLPVIS